LSYTTFSFSNLSISTSTLPTITLKVKNTGPVSGAEVVQVYVAPPLNDHSRPVTCPRKELRGFQKVYLQPGEEKSVEIKLDRFSGAYWDELVDEWVISKGEYGILVGNSSDDDAIALRGTWKVEATRRWTGL
jgi:beta-glucosidase